MNSRLSYIALAGYVMTVPACGGGDNEEACGDGVCDEEEDEDCEECPEDCGECETLICEEGDCMYEACNGDYLHIHFAAEILAQPACAGGTLPAWFSENQCFIAEYEWGLLADPAAECKFFYAHCPCDDDEYEWAAFAGPIMGVVLTDPAAVAAVEPFACGEVDEFCLRGY